VHATKDGGDQPDRRSATLDLAFETYAIAALGASIVDATDIGTYTMEYALHNWAIFPGRGKVPAIPNPHPKGSRERTHCKGECGLLGHGVFDATTDLAQIAAWWGGRYAGANILGRVPAGMFVLDVDPQNGGDVTITEHKRIHGPLPKTLATLSGRGTGGSHRFYRRPAGKLSSKRLGLGIDIKTSAGYVVLPPSIHPDTGKPYIALRHPVADPPRWLVELIKPADTITPPTSRRSPPRYGHLGGSIADQFSAGTSWADVLGPHGWECPGHDYDEDGAVWLHPAHTSSCSATVRHGCLFVYSTSTVFEVTEESDPHGYTRFRAYAVLNHDGDMSAAARVISGRSVA
jgi:hypothetical protein